ncbi:MAG: CHASE2 domain-containing protein [Proteobacteria bacterium]|nr:CHASE2 domain-containing protein [Pseudomonadota bacterium]
MPTSSPSKRRGIFEGSSVVPIRFSKETELRVRRALKTAARLGGFGLLSFAVAFVLATYQRTDDGQRKELATLQQFYSLRPYRPPPAQVVIASIDEQTYADFHDQISVRDKFPRALTAEALERIQSAAPALLVLDLKLPREQDDPAADARIEAQIRARPTTIWSGELPASDDSPVGLSGFPTIRIPSDERFSRAAAMELSMWTRHRFGVRYELTLSSDQKIPLEKRIVLLPALRDLSGLPVHVPGDFDLINFYGPRGTIQKVSVSRILRMSPAELGEAFGGKVVLMGYHNLDHGGAKQDKDEFPVAVSSQTMYGVEIHATIAGNILDGSAIKRLPEQQEATYLYLALLLLTVAALALRPEWSIPFVLLIGLGYHIAAYQAFSHYQLWLPGVRLLWIGALLISIAGMLYHYLYLKRLARVWQDTFDFELEEG